MADEQRADGADVLELIQQLTGQDPPLRSNASARAKFLIETSGLGHSQMNELLLLHGYDRISSAFFQYLVDGTSTYASGSAITTIDQLRSAVDRFRKHALLLHGNVKYAFKFLSSLSGSELGTELSVFKPLDDTLFSSRHDPVQPIESIAGDETYYLGYVIKRQLDARLEADPNDVAAREELEKRKTLVAKGIRNHEAYLSSDHMDVYVATSMRERHEYFFVHSVTAKIFGDPRLQKLKLRWFDPTQAYCSDRIDKGLSEALMLKRAKCTLYYAQESDTLGKDSELASTLAQGKPVIAFLPQLNDKTEGVYIQWLLDIAQRLYPDEPIAQLLIQQLQVFESAAAWKDPIVQRWVNDPSNMNIEEAKTRLMRSVRKHYDGRADLLKETHPLGIQVHLGTGVANGVLVARTTAQCAEMIYRVMTNRLEFTLEEVVLSGRKYLMLRESVSRSIFRVVTGDQMLTNSFWNFYLG
jgi:hypothetical protein